MAQSPCGEHRPYDRQSGTFDRVEPREHFFRVRAGDRVRMGMGAWEIAMRLSHLDLTDKGIEGGRLTDLTVGLNWYSRCIDTNALWERVE